MTSPGDSLGLQPEGSEPPLRPAAKASMVAFLLLSGAAALVYQVTWARQLTWFMGADVYAVSVVVAAFFAGLGIGSALFGSRADASPAPMRLYAGIEIGIAAVVVAWIPLLDRLPAIVPFLSQLAAAEPPGPLALRAAVAFAVLLPPTILIGGTFPAITRAWVRHQRDVGAGVSLLYTMNTVGALAGTLLTGFVLVRVFGISRSIALAAATNLAIGIWALLVARAMPARRPLSRQHAAGAPGPSPDWLILALSGGAGFFALATEVLWTRALISLLSLRVYAFSVVLAVYLLGIALGSAIVARTIRRARSPWLWLATAHVAAGIATLAALLLLPVAVEVVLGSVAPALQRSGGSVALGFFGKTLLLPLLILLPPTIATGASFPLAAAIACADLPRLGAHLGRLYAVNTFGGILGALVAGLVLVPWLGFQNALLLCVALTLAIAAVALLRQQGGRRLPVAVAAALAAVGALALVIKLPPTFYVAVATRITEGDLLFFREDPTGTVAVLRQGRGAHQYNRLYVDGISNSGDSLPSRRYMRLQAHLPILLHPGRAERVLVICFGTGITYDAVFRHDEVAVRRCAEISPAVLATAPLFAEANHSVASAAGADIRVVDGRALLQYDPEGYDVITLEPPPPTLRGVVSLYSEDFYQLCRQRLRPGGIMAQWLPLPTQNLPETQMLVRTFLSVFPHATLWTTEIRETLLLGSAEPLRVDLDELARRMSATGVLESLAPVGIRNADQLLATFLLDAPALHAFAAGAPVVTDDHPLIEYSPFQKPGETERQLRLLLDQRTPLTALPGVADADPDRIREILATQSVLLDFYEASLASAAGDMDSARRHILPVQREDPDNPYYRWWLQ